MTVTILNSLDKRKRLRIRNTLTGLELLPNVKIIDEDECNFIRIKHRQEYIPDFELVWCDNKKHYRVYILIASTKHIKENNGYCIFTIPNQLAAMGFGTMYGFIYKYRANNKSLALPLLA